MTESQSKGQWEKGKSGNPKGRPHGLSVAGRLRAAIHDDLPAIIDQLKEKALGGDVQAARILIERVLPQMKAVEMPVMLELPADGGLTEQGQAVMRAMAAGQIAPGQAAALLSGLGNVAKLKEIDELTARIEALEKGARI